MKKLCGMWDSREKGAGKLDQDSPSRLYYLNFPKSWSDRIWVFCNIGKKIGVSLSDVSEGSCCS